MGRIIFLLLYFCSLNLAHDFVFELDYIYKLSRDDIILSDDSVEIAIERADIHNQNRTLKSSVSKIVMDNELNFYYHTNKFRDYIDSAIPLKRRDGRYFASLDSNLSKKIADSKNCFLIIKNIDDKAMRTKNKAMLVWLNELEALNNSHFYLSCVSSSKYIN